MPPQIPIPLETALARALEFRGDVTPYAWSQRSGIPLTTIQRCLAPGANPRLATLLPVLASLGVDLAWLHAQGVRPTAG